MIFVFSVALSLVRVWVFFCCLSFILELKTEEGWFFQRVDLCIWAIGGHELGTLSIPVHNSLTVYDNSWALKFDNFSEFQNVISDRPPPRASLWRFAYENRYVSHVLSYQRFNRNLPIYVSLVKDWFMLHKKFNQEDLAT